MITNNIVNTINSKCNFVRCYLLWLSKKKNIIMYKANQLSKGKRFNRIINSHLKNSFPIYTVRLVVTFLNSSFYNTLLYIIFLITQRSIFSLQTTHFRCILLAKEIFITIRTTVIFIIDWIRFIFLFDTLSLISKQLVFVSTFWQLVSSSLIY